MGSVADGRQVCATPLLLCSVGEEVCYQFADGEGDLQLCLQAVRHDGVEIRANVKEQYSSAAVHLVQVL